MCMGGGTVCEYQATDDFQKLSDIDKNPLPESSQVVKTVGAPPKEDVLTRIAKQNEEEGVTLWQRIRGRDEEQRKGSGKKGKSHKFRTLVRMIKTNLQWTKDLQEKNAEDEGETFVVKVGSPNTTGPETLTFDASHYKVKDRTYGGLTAKARKILLKHPLERTEEELGVLRDVVDRLKCFMKYPSKVKREIARVIFYESYTDGRIIIQQGHIGQSFYFIVSGKVDVTTMKVHPDTGQKEMQVLGELNEGSTFGELALLHNITRTATIICKGNSEFLRVDKEDFEAVLRSSYEREWNERLRALGWLECFKDWSHVELANFNNFCALKEYPRDKVIYGNVKSSENIYFVISGECLVVRQICLIKEMTDRRRAFYRLPTKGQLEALKEKLNNKERRSGTNRLSVPETRYWNIGTMGSGFYFGVGEDMEDTYIISRTKLEVLVVPRVQFKPGRGRILDKMVEELEALLPSNDTLYRLHYEKYVWNDFKQRMTADIIRRNPIPNPTKFTDVPLAIRNYHYGYSSATQRGTVGPTCGLIAPPNSH